MFHDWKNQRMLQGFVDAERDKAMILSQKIAEAKQSENNEQLTALKQQYVEALREMGRRANHVALYRSLSLIRKAQRLAIEIPSAKEKPSWWDNDYEDGMPDEAVTEWLSEIGRIGTRKLIKLERRANFEWWFTKIVLPTLQALVPILALILGLISVSTK